MRVRSGVSSTRRDEPINAGTPPKAIYPQYKIDFDGANVEQILDMARKLLTEVGLLVSYPPFMERIAGKSGLATQGERVCFEPALVEHTLDDYRTRRLERFEKAAEKEREALPAEWKILSGGFSLDVIDMVQPGRRSTQGAGTYLSGGGTGVGHVMQGPCLKEYTL